MSSTKELKILVCIKQTGLSFQILEQSLAAVWQIFLSRIATAVVILASGSFFSCNSSQLQSLDVTTNQSQNDKRQCGSFFLASDLADAKQVRKDRSVALLRLSRNPAYTRFVIFSHNHLYAMAGYPIQGFNILGKLKVHSGLVLVTFGFASFQILTKIGLARGISEFVYPFYRNLIGFIVVAVLAYFSEKKVNAHLTPWLLIQFFFLALLGITLNQSFYLLGLALTDPTFASALQNSIPTIVFMMATTLGYEQVKWRRRDGQAKLVGALLGVGGAVVMATYKGPALFHHHVELTPPLDIERPFLSLLSSQSFSILGVQIPKWQLGALALLGNCASFAIWTVLQTPMLRKYPARLSMVAYVDLFATIQLAAFALWQEPKLSGWKISDGYNLFIILYAGLIGSGMAFTLQTWCVQQAGPVVTAAYQPLQTVMVGLLALPILGDDMCLGSIVGAMLIISGLYMITWGQAEEKRISELRLEENDRVEEKDWKIEVEENCSIEEPLLQGMSHTLDDLPERR